MNKLSVQLKIIIWYSVLFISMVLVMVGFMYFFMGAFMDNLEEQAIIDDSHYAASIVEYVGGELKVDDSAVDTDLLFAIYDLDDSIIYNNKPRGLSLDPTKEYGVIRTVHRGQMTWDFYDAKITENNIQVGSIRIVRSRTFLSNVLYELLVVIASLVPFFIIAAVFGGRFLVKRAFKPISDIRKTAHLISKGDMSQRIDIKTDDEFGGMSKSINDMLELIEESYKRERQFSANISHELKTPLAIIIAHAENALDGEKTLSDYRDSMQSIYEESKDMADMVNDFLKYSRMAEKKIEFEKTNISLIVAGVADEMRVVHDKAIISTDIEKNLWLMADQMLLTRMVMNLLDNAIRHGEDGRVDVKLQQNGAYIELRVLNEGTHIDEENLDRIFKRRFSAPIKGGKGFGIGLSIVKWVADVHGSDIFVRNIQPKGVEFYVKLGSDRLPM